MRSHTVAYKTGMDLGYYFAGYYLFAFAVFIVLEYPIVRPSGILALLLWVIEFIMTATLMVQFWIFMNAVYQQTFKRMLLATSAGAAALIITMRLANIF